MKILTNTFKISPFECIIVKYGYGLNCLLAIVMTIADNYPHEFHIPLIWHFLNYHMGIQQTHILLFASFLLCLPSDGYVAHWPPDHREVNFPSSALSIHRENQPLERNLPSQLQVQFNSWENAFSI